YIRCHRKASAKNCANLGEDGRNSAPGRSYTPHSSQSRFTDSTVGAWEKIAVTPQRHGNASRFGTIGRTGPGSFFTTHYPPFTTHCSVTAVESWNVAVDSESLGVDSENRSCRFQCEIAAIQAEMRAVIRVAGGQELAPLEVEEIVFALEPPLLLGRVLVAAGLRFEMVELSLGRPD